MRSWVWAAECAQALSWSKRMLALSIPRLLFELHASVSSAFHNRQQSLLLCLGAKILPREHIVCPRIRCTWTSLLKMSAWTFPFSASQYAFSASIAVFRCDMGHPCLVSCHNRAQHAVSFLVIAHQKCQSTCNMLFFCDPLWAYWAPIVHALSDNPNDYWQYHSPWNLRKVQGQIRNCETCRHALFSWPYAPNHHSPKMDAHFAPHRARSLVLHWTSEPIS